MTRKKTEAFWKKFPPSQPNTTHFELEIWPNKRFKGGPRAGNTGLGGYKSMHDVEQAVKRIQKGYRSRRSAQPEFRVYMVYTERQRVH